jgi:hypothetical protein
VVLLARKALPATTPATAPAAKPVPTLAPVELRRPPVPLGLVATAAGAVGLLMVLLMEGVLGLVLDLLLEVLEELLEPEELPPLRADTVVEMRASSKNTHHIERAMLAVPATRCGIRAGAYGNAWCFCAQPQILMLTRASHVYTMRKCVRANDRLTGQRSSVQYVLAGRSRPCTADCARTQPCCIHGCVTSQLRQRC